MPYRTISFYTRAPCQFPLFRSHFFSAVIYSILIKAVHIPVPISHHEESYCAAITLRYLILCFTLIWFKTYAPVAATYHTKHTMLVSKNSPYATVHTVLCNTQLIHIHLYTSAPSMQRTTDDRQRSRNNSSIAVDKINRSLTKKTAKISLNCYHFSSCTKRVESWRCDELWIE
jgi:ABC-type anion transport system duplicated permease subunit